MSGHFHVLGMRKPHFQCNANRDVATTRGGVTFSDSDSAPVPKFLNPGPVIIQIWESDSCSDSATIIDPTVIYPCFYLRNCNADSCYYRNGKVTPDPGPVFHKFMTPDPVSSEISDLRKISDLLLSFGYCASQIKQIKSGNYFFGMCYVNQNILVRCQVLTTSCSVGESLNIENFGTYSLTSIFFLFLTLTQNLTRHTYLNTNS